MKKSILKSLIATVIVCALFATVAGKGSVTPQPISDAVSEEVLAAESDDADEFVIYKGTLLEYNGDAKKVVIPNSVKEISYSAFEGCDAEVIVIGKKVKKISEGAFQDCEKLKKFQVASGNKYFKVYDNALYNKGKTKLIAVPAKVGKIKFSTNTKTIGEYAFANISLDSLKLPSKVKTIKSWAFYKADIDEVKLPKSATTVESAAFYEAKVDTVDLNCVKNVDSGAFTYAKVKKVIWSTKATKIKAYTFSYSELKSITLNSKVKTIENDAFYVCKKLKSITIPKSVTKIGVDAFYGCVNGKVAVNGYSNTAKLFTIKAVKNSKAHKYAKKYGFKYKEIK